MRAAARFLARAPLTFNAPSDHGRSAVSRTLGGLLPALAVLACLSSVVHAQGPAGAGAPPSPSDVLGYELGSRFTDVAAVNRYMRALAEASDLVSVEEYGTTLEGRPLIQVVVAKPSHRARMDQILGLNAELTAPETPSPRAEEIATSNPAVVYLSYGIHGSESSSSEAAMWTAWDLSRGAPELEGVLDSVIVILDPVVNPDGRDRYVNFYGGARGEEPNPKRETREHREPWPGGRYNHYLFDLNRDWAWMVQPETIARLATWPRWNPQVHVDFHEMGSASSYFFFPAARPVNPIFPEHTLEWGRRFGEGNARAFDAEGWLYFTGENFDLFYPGYGDSWPSLLGAIGMTYEQAGGGGAGLVVERPDGTLLTLRDRALHHRVAGGATLRTVRDGKRELLAGFADFHRSVDEGLPDVLLIPGDDGTRLDSLVGLLLEQGIEVDRAGSGFRAEASAYPGYEVRRSFPAGTARVRARQSRGRLAFALLRPEARLDGDFAYDITSWSLPYAYGVEAHTSDGVPEAAWVPAAGPESQAREAEPSTEGSAAEAAPGSVPYGYLVRPSFAVMPALVRFLEGKGRAFVMADTFTIGGARYPYGTLFLPRGRNADGLEGRVRDAGLAPFAIPTSTGLTEGGPDLGTNDAEPLKLPRVALVGGEGTSPTSFGAHWFFLEQRLGVPFDAVDLAELASLDLSEYDVVLVPSAGGDFARQLGDGGLEALEAWVRDGGTLVGVGGGAQRLAASVADVEERRAVEEDDEPDRDERLARALRTREQREQERWRERIPGTILPVSLDPRHPLVFGAGTAASPDRMFILSSGVAFEPDDSFESVAHFPEGLQKVSGVISDESLERLDRSTWLLERGMGRGKIILFADDPLFRMFWYSGFQPYANAILLAPAF